jgi:uncharacterized OB-fold protein
MNELVRSAAIEGWYTLDDNNPSLLGSRCCSCGTFFFPPLKSFCRNPVCMGIEFDSVPLSRTGHIWSYTNAVYQPPEPYVAAVPFVPFAIAAVELAYEKMIILGQMVEGVTVADLRVGAAVELVVETLYQMSTEDKVIWKWRPCGSGAGVTP